MPEFTDEQIVRRALTDKEAFALLIERYEDKLSRYLQRLGVATPEDREDLLQNTFIKAYRNLESFDPDLQFSSWIYRITHNEAMSFFRARKVRPQVRLSEEGERLITELSDEASDSASLAEHHISSDVLSSALATLSPRYRDALALRFFEDRSYTEISDILEVPVGTVSTLIHRAKRALKDALPPTFTL